jgi:oxalate decarboxylase
MNMLVASQIAPFVAAIEQAGIPALRDPALNQGLNSDGCEFILVFDDGEFSESETVLPSDAMAHLPPEVLAKTFAVGQDAFKNVPREELFIFQTDVPGRLEADQKAAASAWKIAKGFYLSHDGNAADKADEGGEVRVVDASNFKVSTTAMAMVTVHPGGLRELHWHPECRRVAVFYQWEGTNDRGGDRQQSSDNGLSGGRRRILAEESAALRRE